MIWIDREVKKIKERKSKVEWVDDMKTPSGRIHVGSLRGIIVHDLLYKVLMENGVTAKFSYVFNDMDQMDALPTYLDKEKYEKYLGFPLNQIPSPQPGYKSFAEYFAKEFMETFEKLNCHPQIIWSSELYASGKMNKVIKEILDRADKVRDVYLRITKAKRPKDWYPFQVICEKCGKIGTTYVYKWDGVNVYYRCLPDMVAWAKGCLNEGKVSPYDGKGKLVWRLDWPAHWKTIGITVECSGKDHMSSGGSYDFAKAVCEEVINYPPPYAFGYEWFTIGGKKMSSSKGIGTSAKEVSSILPAEIFRFFLVRSSVDTHLDFDPFGDTIPDIFDDYDRCLNAYFLKLENKIPEGKPGEVILEFARIMELSEVKPLVKKRIFLPRFRTIANLLKSKTDLVSFFEKQKKSKLTPKEREILEEREIFAQVYLKNYATNTTASVVQGASVISNSQRKFLELLADDLEKNKPTNHESVRSILLDSLSRSQIKPEEAFRAIYRVLINADSGPKAQDLISQIGIDEAINLFKKAQSESSRTQSSTKYLFPTLKEVSVFSIDNDLAKKFPSMNIGIAIIKDVSIKKSDPRLDEETKSLLDSLSNLTTEAISGYPEIQVYRKLYREMKVDWHSRRPSPEALLRRIARKKGLYKINTCVDAYNLIVTRNRVSSGAFDLDKIKLPTVIRLAKIGEKILLLGDSEPTEYEPTEIAYFDQVGGYNIDFNYRDAQRTAVTEETKNILINIDGVYDITREMVEKTLKDTINIITKYCGGQVELAAVAAA